MPSSTASALHDTVLTAVGRAIAAGKLAAGQVITLDDIGIEHRVSRSLAREVVRVLESMGMVESRRRIGITIAPARQWNVLDARLIGWQLESGDRTAPLAALIELRQGFEPAAAALAAGRAQTPHCRELAAIVSDLQMAVRSGDGAAYRQADKDFHQIVVESSGNAMFRALSALVADVLCCELSSDCVDLHDAVARAIRQADGSTAESVMREIAAKSPQLI
ncbi:FadR/GntR family transcriptional regulator [Mycobacterium sp. MAA66]|uniref:FadR/GntR family transcriptional regulator n=1 Tax=Mycobacterium sp. MAA66 TaxID=3156297 RepID=UPI0035196266